MASGPQGEKRPTGITEFFKLFVRPGLLVGTAGGGGGGGKLCMFVCMRVCMCVCLCRSKIDR